MTSTIELWAMIVELLESSKTDLAAAGSDRGLGIPCSLTSKTCEQIRSRPTGRAAITVPVTFGFAAIASSADMPTQGMFREFLRPSAVAIPIRIPVKLPGPRETAIRLIILRSTPWRASISMILGSSSSARDTLSLPVQPSSSDPFERRERLPPAMADSIANVIPSGALSVIVRVANRSPRGLRPPRMGQHFCHTSDLIKNPGPGIDPSFHFDDRAERIWRYTFFDLLE